MFINLKDEYCLNSQKENQNKEKIKKRKKDYYENSKGFFQCDLCDKNYTTKYSLNRHKRNQH